MTNNELGFNLDKDFELPKSWNSYFKVEEWKHKIRLLQGPIMQYEVWHEAADGTKTKEVFENTPENSKKPGAKLVWNILIYNYWESVVQIWTISQRKVMQNFIDLNVEVNLSSIDITLIRKWKTMNDTTYTLIPWAPSEFTVEEALKEVKEKSLAERLVSKDEWTLEAEEKAIEAEIAAKKVQPATTADAEEVFK